jgi:hypothetical protein
MKISFGQKIPIAQCGVYDKIKNAYTKAVLYEFDGKDASDIDYFVYQTGNWSSLKNNMTVDLYDKNQKYKKGIKNNGYEKKFYSLEAQEGKSIGICETSNFMNYTDIIYLNCNPDKNYKYAGQAMLAGISKPLEDKEDALLTVTDPADSARYFYVNCCGFTPIYQNKRELQMNSSQMKQFVKNVEKLTNKPVINL